MSLDYIVSACLRNNTHREPKNTTAIKPTVTILLLPNKVRTSDGGREGGKTGGLLGTVMEGGREGGKTGGFISHSSEQENLWLTSRAVTRALPSLSPFAKPQLPQSNAMNPHSVVL